jgi:hypothetical protein
MKKRKKKKMSVSILDNSNLYNFEKISKPDPYDNGLNSTSVKKVFLFLSGIVVRKGEDDKKIPTHIQCGIRKYRTSLC